MPLTEVILPAWIWFLLLVALLVGGLEPLVRLALRFEGAAMFLAKWFQIWTKSWPVQITVKEVDWQPVYQGSETLQNHWDVYARVSLRLREKAVMVRTLLMVQEGTKLSWAESPRGLGSESDPSWGNGFSLEGNDAFDCHFSVQGDTGQGFYLQVTAGGRDCRSRVLKKS